MLFPITGTYFSLDKFLADMANPFSNDVGIGIGIFDYLNI